MMIISHARNIDVSSTTFCLLNLYFAFCMFLILLCSPAALGAIPPEWQANVNNADMLYSDDDTAVDPNNMPMIGNGFVALQIGNENMYISGVFNNFTHYWTSSHRAVIPTGLAAIAVKAPGISSDAALDVRKARYLRRSYIDPSALSSCTEDSQLSCTNSGGRIVVEQRFYAHRSIPTVLVMEVEVISGGDSSDDSLPYAMLKLENSSPINATIDVNFTAVEGLSSEKYSAFFGWTQIPEAHPYCPPPCTDANIKSPGADFKGSETPSYSGFTAVGLLASNIGMLKVSSLNQVRYFFTIVRTSIETPANEIVSSLEADYAKVTGMASDGSLFSTHAQDWAENFWTSGFETDRIDVARAVNTSMYAILSSVRTDRPFSLAPGGLTQGYNGHTFWDCETWMYPPVLFLYPDLAASLIEYRYNRLDGAREKARSYTPPYSGVMFPWESAYAGGETCPYFAGTGLREIHISGDVAYAVWQYWRVTKDLSTGWLDQIAWPILSGVADFWVSKTAVDNPDAGPDDPLHIKDVIPPDEYADHVTDSIYTNSVAVLSLQYAIETAILLGKEEEVASSISSWRSVADRIVCITAENEDGVWHPEFEGYSLETIKQADAVLLGYPLGIKFADMTPQSRVNDLVVYEAVSDGEGPAMTWGMMAMGYIEMGESRAEDAARNFNRSFVNVHPPFNVWTESPDGGAPNFLTGAGGFLQAAYFGYPQLRIEDDQVTLKPCLPELTNFVKLRGFHYLGNKLDMHYDASTIVFQVSLSSDLHQLVLLDSLGKSYKMSAGSRFELAYTQGVSTFTIKACVSDSDKSDSDLSGWSALSLLDKSLVIGAAAVVVLVVVYFGWRRSQSNSKCKALGGSGLNSQKSPLLLRRPQDNLYSVVDQRGEGDGA